MDEKSFQLDFLKSCKKAGFYVKKIPDAIRSPQARFIPSKPYDLFAVHDGQFYAMELKYFRPKELKTKVSSFSLNRIRDNQLEELREVEKHGGKAFVVIVVDFSETNSLSSCLAYFIPIWTIPDNKGVFEFDYLDEFFRISRKKNKKREQLKHIWEVERIFEIMDVKRR